MKARAWISVIAAILFAASLLVAAEALSPHAGRSAAAKLGRVFDGGLEAGETVVLSQNELNSFLRYDYQSAVPKGLREVEVELFSDAGTVRGKADLAELSAASGSSPGKLMLALLGGERDFAARCRFVSANGVGKLEIDSFLLDGREFKGVILKWLLNTVAADQIEGFQLGEPFRLGANLQQIRLEPGRMVFIGR